MSMLMDAASKDSQLQAGRASGVLMQRMARVLRLHLKG